MNGYQITNALANIPETERLFRGCYYNRNIPFRLFNEESCFFVVNTISNLRTPMGHWVAFYIKDYNLIFIDSFGMTPEFYGWDINDFYALYPGCRSKMLNKPIQNEFSYVCGAYCVVMPYLLSKFFNQAYKIFF